MKKQSTQNSENISIYWKPENEGDFVEGKFETFYQGEKTVNLKLDTKIISVSSVMKGIIRKNISLFEPGVNIKVQYEKTLEKHKKGQQPAKLFNIWLNKKQLESDYAIIELKGDELLEALK